MAARGLPPELFGRLCKAIENLFFCYRSSALRAVKDGTGLEKFIEKYFLEDMSSRAERFDFAFRELSQSACPVVVPHASVVCVNLIPGMNQTPETAAGRYIQASKFGTDVSGQFFASAKGKFSGPMEVQRQPHLHDRDSQEAAWQAVVKVSSVDLSPSGPTIKNGP